MAQQAQLSSRPMDEPSPSESAHWRWLMEDPPSEELFGWAVLVLLAFAPPIGWLLASVFREMFG